MRVPSKRWLVLRSLAVFSNDMNVYLLTWNTTMIIIKVQKQDAHRVTV